MHVARSMRVAIGVVTGMFMRRVTSPGRRVERRWAAIPAWRCPVRRGTDTWMLPPRCSRTPHSAAALSWLSTPSGAQARMAAIHFPSRVRSARPTAYTPRYTGWSRPVATRCLIAASENPSAKSWTRPITPCCLSASAQALLARVCALRAATTTVNAPKPIGAPSAEGASARAAGCYSGMLPCLRFGCSMRLVCSVRSARISFGRVSWGTITSSM
jgi:hypothetical protein